MKNLAICTLVSFEQMSKIQNKLLQIYVNIAYFTKNAKQVGVVKGRFNFSGNSSNLEIPSVPKDLPKCLTNV